MANAGDLTIEANGLAKRFEKVQAVNDVSFEVRRGEVYGFLGPNGAGKTTTFNMLTGLARADARTIRSLLWSEQETCVPEWVVPVTN